MSLEIIILAAGVGSRMKSALPKVLHCVAGKPLLQHVLDVSATLNPQKIHVVIGHGKDQVKQHIENLTDSKQINWVEQKQRLGTGHAVQQALPHVAKQANVLVLYGDVPLIKAQSLTNLIQAMHHYPLSLLTAFVDNPQGYGRILHDQADNVCAIVEQKDATAEQQRINEINTGIICARANQLSEWLAQTDNQNAQKEYYLTDIVGLAYQSGNPIASFQPDKNNEFMGINSRQELAVVERCYQREQVDIFMQKGVTFLDPNRVDIRGQVTIGADTIIDVNTVIEGATEIGSNVNISSNCVIKASKIADNVTIYPSCVIEQASIADNVNIGPFARLRPGTQLQSNVRIGNFVETKNAQLGAGVKINHLSYVGDAQVGQETNIGAGVITCNYDGANKHKTNIGSDVFVGSDCQLVAPLNIEDGATIGAGSTITNDVGKDQLAVSRSKQRNINHWQRPVKEHK